jgi:uncharacterized protein (DUF779 family)
MSDIAAASRLTVTLAAREAISRLRAAQGGPVMFVQSGGCCAGSTPMCFPHGELIIGDIDVLLGDIDGCPFYIDARLDDAWGRDQLVLDVATGPPEGFSLAAGDNLHFVTRSSTCATPSITTEWSSP